MFNQLELPELFYSIASNLSDKEKLFLSWCSKATYCYLPLLKFNLIYDLYKIYNLHISKLFPEEKIKELIENNTIKLITINKNYIRWIYFRRIKIQLRMIDYDKMIKKFIKNGSNYLAMILMLKKDGMDQAFLTAVSNGHYHLVQLLIKNEANVQCNDNSAIIIASRNGHTSIAKLLIDEGANIHAQDTESIVLASGYGNCSMVKLLIESGANVSAQNNQSIIYASLRDHLEIAEILINNGADVRAQGNRAYHYALMFDYAEMAELLKNKEEFFY